MADEATREKETQRKPKQTDKSKAEGKDTFRAFRDMAGRGNPREGTEAETEAEGREQNQGQETLPRLFRDMAEDRDRDRERDDDQGIERTPKKKPPTPPRNDR